MIVGGGSKAWREWWVLSPRWSAATTACCGTLAVLGLLAYPHPAAWAGLVALVLLAAARWATLGAPVPPSPFSLPLGLYAAGAVLGLGLTVDSHTAGIRFFGVLAALGAFFLTLSLVTSQERARRAVWGVVVATLLATVLLYALVAPNERDRLPPSIRQLTASVMPYLADARRAVLKEDEQGMDQRFRLYSSGLSMVAAVGVAVSAGPLFAGPSRRARYGAALAVCCFGLLLVVAGNRTALVSAALVVSLLGAARYRWLLAVPLLLATFAAAVLGGLLPLAGFFSEPQPLPWLPGLSVSTDSWAQRLEIWGNVLYLLRSFPFSGVGLGIGSARAVHALYFQDVGFAHAHNVALQTYLEQGLVGLAGLAGLVGVAIAKGWRGVVTAHGAPTGAVALSAAGTPLTLLLCSTTEIGTNTTIGMTLLFGACGLLAAVSRLQGAALQDAARPGRAAFDPDGRLARQPAAAGARNGREAWRRVAVGLVVAVVAVPAVAQAWDTPRGTGQPPLFSLPSAVVADVCLNLGALDLVAVQTRRGLSDGERDAILRRARARLQTAFAAAPRDPAVNRVMAMAALEDSDRVEARAALARVEAVTAKDDGRAWLHIGRVYRETGDVERAIAAWKRVDRGLGDWSNDGPQVQLADWGAELVDKQRWQDAIVVSRAAIELDPTNQRPYRTLSAAVSHQDGEQAALAAMEQLAQEHPYVAWPFREASTLHDAAGRADQAALWRMRENAVWKSPEWYALRTEAYSRRR